MSKKRKPKKARDKVHNELRRITLSVDTAEHDGWKALAKHMGMTLSGLVRQQMARVLREGLAR